MEWTLFITSKTLCDECMRNPEFADGLQKVFNLNLQLKQEAMSSQSQVHSFHSKNIQDINEFYFSHFQTGTFQYSILISIIQFLNRKLAQNLFTEYVGLPQMQKPEMILGLILGFQTDNTKLLRSVILFIEFILHLVLA